MSNRTTQGKTPSKFKVILTLSTLVILILLIVAAVFEIQTSRLQSILFSGIASRMSYHVEKGKSTDIRFPVDGPYDLRMGYVKIPEWTERLEHSGYTVTSQARWSPEMLKYTDIGAFPIYPEKTCSGTTIFDRNKEEIMHTSFPQRIYLEFESIPNIVVQMLLYVENRYLLDNSEPYRNPAIEWKRQGKAVLDFAYSMVDHSHNVVGGSTLATQIEKFRHSPEGRTTGAIEKLKQISSASLRAYRNGPKTARARRRIVLDYINSIPMAAAPGYGEVIGLGDSLHVWYGMDFVTINRLLRNIDKPMTDDELSETGAAIKAALSIFLAQRRPSAYLLGNRDDLEELTNSYLRVMSKDGLISNSVRDAALDAKPEFSKKTGIAYPNDTSRQKAANYIRSKLLSQLGMERFYDLDRIDLTAQTTIDLELQKKATTFLRSLKDPAVVKDLGLIAPFLLQRGDPANVIYSFSLYEKTPDGNLLRLQTNNYNGPFNIDEQTKLDLGSSAKLRTLIHYVEIIENIHNMYSGLDAKTLTMFEMNNTLDPLTLWGVNYLKTNSNRSLQDMLDASMERNYSAGTGERFFTGGGLHSFGNFERSDNGKILTVSKAFYNSVNLVFVRMMRDIVYYHIFQRYGTTPRALEKIPEDEKKRLLSVFADKEGIHFIRRFYEKYNKKNSVDALETLYDGISHTPPHLAALFRYFKPEASFDEFNQFLQEKLPDSDLTDKYISKLYNDYAPGKFPLADIGYITSVHPLELWLVRFICKNPGAGINQIIEESRAVRQEVYKWLFKSRSIHKQFQRIRTIIELEAFQDIHRAWKNVGYPFDYLTPSYATSIGSSGDRPGALAELAGIIQNNGIRKPLERINSLHFAVNTPFETKLDHVLPEGERVLSEEVAQTIKKAMMGVVQEGTARRIMKGMTEPDGRTDLLGGKTGTGDNRYKTFGPGGVLLKSQVINRTAIFVFFIGDRFFGTMTAFVNGKDAGNYSFSSGLPVQVLKLMLPDISSLCNPSNDQTISIVLPMQGLKMMFPDISPFFEISGEETTDTPIIPEKD